jgi:hypothetical protein
MKTTLVSLAVVLALATVCPAAIDLLPGGFFAPDDPGDWPAAEQQTWLRWGTDYLLYVTEPGEVTVTITGRKVGRYEDVPKLTITDPAGNEVASVKAETIGEAVTAAFTATEIGPYALTIKTGRNPFTLSATGAKLLLPAGVGGQEMHGVSRSAPTYLFVPPGARSFTVAVSGQGTGETVSCELLGPDGTQVAAFNTTGKMTDEKTVTVPDGADGSVWCMSAMTRGDDGVFEDFGYSLAGDISPYVSEDPADLLCPIISAESGLVSREARDENLTVDITLYADFAELGDAKLTLGVLPVEDAGGEPIYEDTRESATARQFAMGPDGRLDTGKYAWELTLLQGGDEVTSFSGLWYYIPAPKFIAADGTTLVNGEPFFARGLYHVDPEDYALIKAHGFNCVQTHADNIAAVGAAGLKAGVALYWGSRPYSEKWQQKVLDNLDNDAIFAWWIQDEPDGGRVPLETMADAYLFIREQDPNRPAYTCLCVPDKYPQYAPQTDIVSMDVYPIGRSPITHISDTLEHAQDVIPNHVHWFIGQVWSWPNTRLVTAPEHRCMTYLALAHGARGLFWYSFNDPKWHLPDQNPEVWAECKVVNDELTELEPALLTPNIGEAVFHPAEGEGQVHASAKRVGDDLFVIAVNPSETPVIVSLTLADLGAEAADGDAEVMFEDRTVAVADGAIADDFAGLAAHVYRVAMQ